MSTEPYPEVTGDESGIVPPQSGRAPEWPKKIRTLTASELDRLTIDGAGRFYWDGKLVNYEPPKSSEPEPKSPDAGDRSAMDIIDRAVYELGDRKLPQPIEGAELPKSVGTHVHREREDLRAVDLDQERAAEDDRADAPPAAAVVGSIRAADRIRLSLSRWQSLGAIVVVLGIAVGASGVAAYGWVVAHDWGCRIGVITSYCPSSPANPATRPPRSDIPA
jgi:hypothetical protein